MNSSYFIRIVLFILISIASQVKAELDKNEIKVTLQSSKITLDPGGVRDTQSLFVSRQVNCELVRAEGSVPVLDAAESIKYLTPLKFSIKISNAARFHDGTAVTSGDVLASFNYIKNSKNVFKNFFTWVVKIDVIDDKTIVFLLKKEIPQLLKVLSSSNYTIYKKDFLALAQKNIELWDKPMGCGGYKVSEFNNDEIQLLPISKGLPIRFFLIGKNQIESSELNKYDLINISIEGKKGALKDFNPIEIFSPRQYFIGLNPRSSKWKNQHERCAFLSKISTEKLIKDYGKKVIPANDLLPKGTLGYSIEADYNHQLIKFGRNALVSKKLEPFCLAYLTVSIAEKNKNNYLNLFKEFYPNIYTMPIVNVKKFGKNFVDSNCDALIMGMTTNYFDGYEFLTIFEDNVANFTGIKNEKLFQEISNSQHLPIAKERANAYRNIINKIAELCVIKPIFTDPTKIIYIRKNLNAPGLGLAFLHQYFLGKISKR